MANDLTLFGANGDNPLPTYLNDPDIEENIKARGANIPTLSFEGKVWSVTMNGEKKQLMRKNAEGDDEPVSVMRVVVVGAAPSRGRAYYEGTYDPTKVGRPLCWSHDGQRPAADVEQPRGTTCKECPMAAKGSRVTDQGKTAVACSQHRLIAVVPALPGDVEYPVLRMKLAITSDYDANSTALAAERWFAWQQYQDFLRNHKVTHTAKVVTKMRFDPNVAYPKILFSPDRLVTQEEWTGRIKEQVIAESTKDLVSGKIPGEVAALPLIDSTPSAEEAAAIVKNEVKASTKKESKAAPASTAGLDAVMKDWGA